jgi:hypothetical protein
MSYWRTTAPVLIGACETKALSHNRAGTEPPRRGAKRILRIRWNNSQPSVRTAFRAEIVSWILMILDVLGPSVALQSTKLATRQSSTGSIRVHNHILLFGETALLELA